MIVARTEPGSRRRLVAQYAPLFRSKLVLLGTAVFGMALLAGVLAPLIASVDPQHINVFIRLQPPSWEHPAGTDHLGRDMFARLVFGARVSLTVGFASVVVSTVAGVMIGVLAAYNRLFDRIVMRIMDGMMAFPVILLALALMAVLGASLTNVVIALSVVYAPRTARIVRGAALGVMEMPYLEAAHALGLGHIRKILLHILPNCLSPVIVQATFTFAYAVQSEAALSFLGAGVPPSVPSWGIMLNEARLYMTVAPWTTVVPGAAIALTVLSLNAIGDGLRDFLDPRTR